MTMFWASVFVGGVVVAGVCLFIVAVWEMIHPDAHIGELEAEIERLKEDVSWWGHQYDLAQEEIERLQAALRGALRMVEDFASGAGFSPSGRAEFEGYRRALEGK